MANKILEAGDNIKWIYYHLDNFISCNLHPLKKRKAKACIIGLHKDDNIIELSDGYFRVYAHLNNKAIRFLSTLENIDDKKHIYPVVNINNFQFQIYLSKNFKKYDSESNKTKYILILDTPEIELTRENCNLISIGTDIMKLNAVIDLLENSYQKDEKKYNNYYKNINKEIPLSNSSISSSSEEIGEEENGKEEEEMENEEDEPLTQVSPVRKKKTIISKSPSLIKVINKNISNDISKIHILPSSIISAHSSIWITKNNTNITPSASYNVLSMLNYDDNHSTNNNNNKSGINEDNNERVINIDDILPRGPDIERNKSKNKSNRANNNNNNNKENEAEKEKTSESQFKLTENIVIDVIVENKILKKEYACVMNLNGKVEKRKIEEVESEIDLFKENYMRKMRRLVENCRK